MCALSVTSPRRGKKEKRLSCSEAGALEGSRWNITDLVCSGLRTGDDFPTPSSSCFNISERIARSLIRVAATRIFANPAQAILELPVNSIDSYRAVAGSKDKIGKFGMGFFSILYWILHHNRSLTIESSDLEDRCSWKATITSENEEFFLSMDHVRPEEKEISGTMITINSGDLPFTQYELQQFNEQLGRLRETRDITISVTKPGDITNIITEESPDDSPVVNISLNAEKIIVADRAAGIPLSVLFSSLLVPSVSTKTIAKGTSIKTYMDHTRLILGSKELPHSLIITVGDVVVAQVKEKKEDREKPSQQFYISLPLGASLPVSRDDVVLTGKTRDIFKENLLLLAYDAANGMRELTTFFSLLRSYVAYSGQRAALEIRDHVYTEILSDPNYLFVPSVSETTDRLVDYLWSLEIERRIVSLPGVSANAADNSLSELLKGHYREDIYWGRKVLILPGMTEEASDGSLPTFLFVNASYTENYPDWVDRIAMSYSKCRLYPLSATRITAKQEKDFSSIVSMLYPELKQDKLAKQVYSAFITKNSAAGDDDVSHIMAGGIFHWVDAYTKYSGYPENIENYGLVKDYLTHIYGFWTGVKLSTTYGQKTHIYASTSWIRIEYNDDILSLLLLYNKVAEKAEELLMDNIKAVLLPDELSRLMELERETYIFAIEMSWQTSGSSRIFVQSPYSLSISMQYLTLSTLFGDKFGLSILRFLLNHGRSYIECYVMLLIYQFYALLIMQKRKKRSNVKDAPTVDTFPFLLDEIRNRYTSVQLRELILGMIDTTNNRIGPELVIPLLRLLELYVKGVNRSLSSLQPLLPIVQRLPYRFTALQLMEHAFTSNIDVNDVEGWASAAANIGQPTIALQSVEIAVNEGTTKDFLPSILTELVQNSIDAVRSSGVAGDIGISTAKLPSSYTISVADPVGIPPAGIFSLMIPFLSTKSASDLAVTGEMGSGFFNVYRQPWSSGVLVETSTGDQSYRILGLPLIKKGRVVDIRYEITPSDPAPRGTRITVEFSEADIKKITSLMASAEIFSRSYLSVIPSSSPLTFNGDPISVPIIYENKEDDVGTYSFTTNNVPSSLLTNGVPFASLRDYLEALNFLPVSVLNEVSTGYIFNLNKGLYTPVQSRNRIFIDPEKRAKLIAFFRNGIFLTTMKRIAIGNISREKAEQYIPFFNSRGDARQLKVSVPFGSKTLSSFFLRTTIGTDSSLNRLINDGIEFIGNKGDMKRFNSYIYTGNPYLHPLIRKVVTMWFENKTATEYTASKPIISAVIPVTGANPTGKVVKKVSNFQLFLGLFSQNFWYSGVVLETRGRIKGTFFSNRLPPEIDFVEGTGFGGRYLPFDHLIQINTTYFPIAPLEKAVNEVVAVYRTRPSDGTMIIRENSALNAFLGISVPSKTLIHEMSHAWRKSNHNVNGAHADITLTIDGKTNTYSFDEAATKVYELIILHGLWDQVLRGFTE